MEAELIKSLAPVFSAAIASIATLGGVYIANRYNRDLSERNRNVEQKQRKSELKLQKLEELYLLFEKWQTDLSNIYIIHLRVYVDQLSHEQALDLIHESYGSSNGRYQSIQMLVNVYFSELSWDYQQVMDVRSTLSKFLSDPAESNLTASSFKKEQDRFDLICKDFKGKLSAVQKSL